MKVALASVGVLLLAAGLSACGNSASGLASQKAPVKACKAIAANYKSEELPGTGGTYDEPYTAWSILSSIEEALPGPPHRTPAELGTKKGYNEVRSIDSPWDNLRETIDIVTSDISGGAEDTTLPISAQDTAKLKQACAPAGVKW